MLIPGRKYEVFVQNGFDSIVVETLVIDYTKEWGCEGYGHMPFIEVEFKILSISEEDGSIYDVIHFDKSDWAYINRVVEKGLIELAEGMIESLNTY